jgi:predicted GNAT family acetyltransferase
VGSPSPEVVNNAAAHRFEISIDGRSARVEYHLRDQQTIVFTHTEVPAELQGRGLAPKLAKAALDHARAANLKVIPICPFVAGYIDRHPEYGDLVVDV